MKKPEKQCFSGLKCSHIVDIFHEKWYTESIRNKGKCNMTEQEELLMLRALVAKQKEELAAKEQLIEKQNIQIENMIQALLHARKKLFGSSTEATKQVEGQMSLFDSVQKLAEELELAQKKITIALRHLLEHLPIDCIFN